MTASAFTPDVDGPLSRRRFLAFGELCRYFLASAAALACDVSFYLGLQGAGASYALSAAVGFAAGLAVIYALSVRWAFQTRSISNPVLEFFIFAMIGLLGLALTEGILWLVMERLHGGRLAAKACAVSCVFAFNFICRKALLFNRDDAAGRTSATALEQDRS